MLNITSHKGFQLTFQNGWTASVQFGRGNYCSKRYSLDIAEASSNWKSENAEILIFDKAGAGLFGEITLNNVNAENVAKACFIVSEFPVDSLVTEEVKSQFRVRYGISIFSNLIT